MNFQDAIQISRSLVSAGLLTARPAATPKPARRSFGTHTRIALAKHILSTPICQNFLKDLARAVDCSPAFAEATMRDWKRRGWFRPELTVGKRLRCYILTERGRIHLTRLTAGTLSLAAGGPAKSGSPQPVIETTPLNPKAKGNPPAASAL